MWSSLFVVGSVQSKEAFFFLETVIDDNNIPAAERDYWIHHAGIWHLASGIWHVPRFCHQRRQKKEWQRKQREYGAGQRYLIPREPRMDNTSKAKPDRLIKRSWRMSVYRCPRQWQISCRRGVSALLLLLLRPLTPTPPHERLRRLFTSEHLSLFLCCRILALFMSFISLSFPTPQSLNFTTHLLFLPSRWDVRTGCCVLFEKEAIEQITLTEGKKNRQE